jgi:hypothetical protein
MCAVSLLPIACSSDSDDKNALKVTATDGLRGTWSAKVEGTNAFLDDFVANGDEVVAYVCDGANVAQWFRGPVGASGFDLTAGEARMTGTVNGDGLVGVVTMPDGSAHAFDAKPVTSAALYRAEAGDTENLQVGGWVVIDGEQRGAIANQATSSINNAPSLNLNTLVVPQLGVAAAPVAPDTVSAPTPNKTYKYVWAAAGDDWASGDGNPATPARRGAISDPTPQDPVPTVALGSRAVWGTGQYTPGAAANEIDVCHRSDNAGAPHALRTLQAEFPEVDFRFLFVACSGAETAHLATSRFAGLGRPHPALDQAPQLDRVRNFRVQEGHLDAVYMSIGANDAGLGKFLYECIAKTLPLLNCASSRPSDLVSRRTVLRDGLDRVNSGLASRLIGPPTKIFVSTYPDFTRAPDGTTCGAPGGTTSPALLTDNLLLVTNDEMSFLRTEVLNRINEIVRERAALRGWTTIDGFEADFAAHGLCDTGSGNAGTWFNTASAGVAAQGSDLPTIYPPGPAGTDVRAAIGATVGSLAALGAAGLAVLGQGLAALVLGVSALKLSNSYSSGTLHPNDCGARGYGTAIADQLREDVRAKSNANARLLTPTNLRVGAADRNGNITLRWHDVSNTDTRHEIEAIAQLPNLQPAPNPIVVNGSDTQEFVHVQTSKAAWTYRVRACNATRCSPYSAPIIGSNFVPRAPTGLTSTLNSPPLTELGQIRTLNLNWTEPDLGVMEHVVRMRQTTPNPSGPTTDVRKPGAGTSTSIVLSATTPTSTVTSFPRAVYQVSIASCSRVGCSNFGPELRVDTR